MYVAERFDGWREAVLRCLAAHCDADTRAFPPDIMAKVLTGSSLAWLLSFPGPLPRASHMSQMLAPSDAILLLHGQGAEALRRPLPKGRIPPWRLALLWSWRLYFLL